MGRTEFLTCNQITSEPWLVEQKQRPQLERNGALQSARASAPQKCLTLPTLLERRFYDSEPFVSSLRLFGTNEGAALQGDGRICYPCPVYGRTYERCRPRD